MAMSTPLFILSNVVHIKLTEGLGVVCFNSVNEAYQTITHMLHTTLESLTKYVSFCFWEESCSLQVFFEATYL